MNRLLPLLTGVVLFASTAAAQELQLPALSPAASVSQVVGTVKVTVDYSSPGKRDRTVFGELVPYGELWRTGANGATTIETTGDLKIGGKDVPAGKYALFSIPGEKTWTMIVNSNPDQGGTGSYDEKLDVARFEVEATPGTDRERLTFVFSDTNMEASHLDLVWAGVQVRMPIEVDSKGRATASIEDYAKTATRKMADGARYYGQHGETAKGLALVEKSLAVSPTWFAMWVKAEILKEMKDNKAAYKALQEAQKLGEKQGLAGFYKGQIDDALASWPKK